MSAARHARRRNQKGRKASGARSGLLTQVTAGVALATALTAVGSQVAPSGLADRDSHAGIVDADVQLTAAVSSTSLTNVPINLLIDLINIPNSEVEANNMTATGFVYGGPWLVTSASNIWGIDPADYARFFGVAASAVPFPALSGADDDMYTGNGFAQQFAKFLAAEMPVDPACDADGCFPNTPVSPITGFRGFDQNLWNFLMLTGAVDMPLIRNFWKVSPLDMLNGYTFGDVENSSGKVYDGLGITGTVEGEDGKSYMPWSNTTFTLEPTAPFENYFAHLMSDPAENQIKIPTLEQVGRMMQTYTAGMVIAFDPITPGSPMCPNSCEGMSQDDAYPAIVRAISNAWPGNTTLEQWLASYDNGTANVPTQHNIDRNIELYRRGSEFWDFNEAPLSDEYVNTGWNPSSLAPTFYNFYKSIGIDPGPLYGDDSSTVTTAAAVARSNAAETEAQTAEPEATSDKSSDEKSTAADEKSTATADSDSSAADEAPATKSTGTAAAKKAAAESASDDSTSDDSASDKSSASSDKSASSTATPDQDSAKAGAASEKSSTGSTGSSGSNDAGSSASKSSSSGSGAA